MARSSTGHILVKTEDVCPGLKNKIEGGVDFGDMA